MGQISEGPGNWRSSYRRSRRIAGKKTRAGEGVVVGPGGGTSVVGSGTGGTGVPATGGSSGAKGVTGNRRTALNLNAVVYAIGEPTVLTATS